MGSQEPSERVAPAYQASDGMDAARLVRVGGTVLDPWQGDILDDWLGRTPAGKWAAPTAGGSVPRQNGKSLLVQARAESGMLMTTSKSSTRRTCKRRPPRRLRRCAISLKGRSCAAM